MELRRVKILRQGPGVPFPPGRIMDVQSGVADVWRRRGMVEMVRDFMPALETEIAIHNPRAETAAKSAQDVQRIVSRARGVK